MKSSHGLMFALIALALAGPLEAGPAYPLKQSANRRYLVDQNNAPCLILGDAPQSLIVNLSTNDAAAYFANRAAHGFNSLWINLLCATYTAGRADASTYDGILPFTGTISSTSSYDLTKPNEAYFQRVDSMLNLAAQQGLEVFLDPCETGSFLSVMLDNGTSRCRAYGQFLGTRYRSFTNIVWMSGNDFQSWRTAGDDAVVRSVALGIQDEDTNHLQTTELDYLVSSSLDDTNWNSILGLNGAYTYFATYAELLADYNRANFLPTFLVEANYEFESLQVPMTTPLILRKQEYWTMTSGACGHLYGNHYTWTFDSGWQSFLDTPGAIQIGYLKAFFEPRRWFDLVPDTNHLTVTSNYGTFSSTDHVDVNDYLTAARTAEGSLAVIYTPVVRQFTVNLSRLGGPAAAHWFDPSSGVYLSVAGSPFTNSGTATFAPPGNNGDGDGDWVLVLETNPPAIPPPPPPRPQFVQLSYATPQSPQTTVSVPFAKAQTAGNANILAIGWNDTNASLQTVSDSAGNSYQPALPTFRGNGMSQAIYCATGIAGGSNTVNVRFDMPAAFVDLRVMEYSGLDPIQPIDQGASGIGLGTFADSGSATISSTNELLVGAGMTSTTFGGPGAGFALRVITSPDADLVEDQVMSVPGAFNATATLSNGAWLMQLAAFHAANGSAPALRIVPSGPSAVLLAWPAASSGFTLQETASLQPSSWTEVTNLVSTVGGEYQVTVPMSGGGQYFRLVKP